MNAFGHFHNIIKQRVLMQRIYHGMSQFPMQGDLESALSWGIPRLYFQGSYSHTIQRKELGLVFM